MIGLEIGSIEGFPEVAITQPYGFFDIIQPYADLHLLALCPEFRDEQVLAQFRYTLANALSPVIGTIHGFQVQHQGSHAATKQIYRGRVHDFSITRVGLLSLGVENQLLDYERETTGKFSLAFSATDTKLNPHFLKACVAASGPLAMGGMRELYWTKGNMKGNYQGALTGLSL